MSETEQAFISTMLSAVYRGKDTSKQSEIEVIGSAFHGPIPVPARISIAIIPKVFSAPRERVLRRQTCRGQAATEVRHISSVSNRPRSHLSLQIVKMAG